MPNPNPQFGGDAPSVPMTLDPPPPTATTTGTLNLEGTFDQYKYPLASAGILATWPPSGSATGTVTTRSDGTWSATITNVPRGQTVTVTITLTDKSGHVGTASERITTK
jgi:hypothetical protein